LRCSIEIHELWEGVSWVKLGLLAVNAVIVAYPSLVLWRSRRAALQIDTKSNETAARAGVR
jgi:uncharacterized membrane protein (DUF2068 family)